MLRHGLFYIGEKAGGPPVQRGSVRKLEEASG